MIARTIPGRTLRAPVALALALLVLAALLWTGTASPVQAEPVRTLIIARQADGSRRFAEELARLWAARNQPTDERLAVETMEPAAARLRALAHDRGDFAIVTAEEAARLLGEQPRLRAVAALWPLYLHALTRNGAVQSLSLPLQVPVWVTETAEYAHQSLWALSRGTPAARERLELFPADWLTDLMSPAGPQVLLFSAPAPAEEVTRALRADPAWRLLPFDPALVEQLRAAHPWLQTAALPAGAYGTAGGRGEWPLQRMVMVAPLSVEDPTVSKMLQTVYGAREGAALFDPLFAGLAPAANAPLAALMPFHPAVLQPLGLGEPAGKR